MKYDPLIRKLLTASVDAKYKQTDVAERLRARCTDNADLIRQMLMNAVCDPRFKLHAGCFSSWRNRAGQCLTAFAEKLMSIPNLTENDAFCYLDDMLDKWLRFCIEEIKSYDDKRLYYSQIKESKSRDILQIKKALEDLLNNEGNDNDYIPLADDDNEKDDVGTSLPWQILESDKDEEDDELDEIESQITDVEENGSDSGIGEGTERNKVLEDNFLTNVPPSLIKLAKIIGRSGDGIMSSSGSFMNATKSDIGGITTGNDLSSLLPTELAMLSEPATQSIFYNNYTTRRLQIFASTSHDIKGIKHRDGPIIICMDTSGSMDGEPVLVAKAVTMAICIIAQRSRRPVLVIRYSSGHELFRLHNIGQEKQHLMDFLSVVDMSGNNENELFRWLFTDIMPKEKDYDSADVLCISDFGWTTVGKKSMELIEEEKRKGMAFYGLNILKDKSKKYLDIEKTKPKKIVPGSPESICDSLWEYCNGECIKTN